MKGTVLALALVVATPAFAGELATETTVELRQVVVLDLTVGDQKIKAKAPIGTPVRLEDVERGVRVDLVPSLDAARGDRVVLEVYRHVGGSLDLVGSTPLPAAGAVEVEGYTQPISAAVVAIEEVELAATKPAAMTPGPEGLRPVRCCITCDGVTACADLCVEMECGSCCIH